jgi:uncharacterized paraquat-inducible protein A
MHDDPLNPLPLTNAVCMHCGYNISGTIPNEDAKVTCPECGIELVRSDRALKTRRDVHMLLVKLLVLPFAIWAFLTTLAALPPFQDSLVHGFAVVIFILGYPLTLLVLFVYSWTSLHYDLEPYPRPYHRGIIPLWICAYSIGTIALFIGAIVLMEAM